MDEFQLIEISKALSNETRLNILSWLALPEQHFDSETIKPIGICVSHIQRKAAMSLSTISNYLAILQKSGLVTAKREGQWTYYKLKPDRFEEVSEYLVNKFSKVSTDSSSK